MPIDPHPPRFAVLDAVQRALAEDLTPLGDITAGLLDPDAMGEGAITARQAGRLAGTRCAAEAFVQVDPAISVDWLVGEGDALDVGTRVAAVSGPLASILTAERTALNFLCHLSGVATLTRQFVERIESAGKATRLWDTRKTTPGLRALEKAAVRAGGGSNHRGNLSEWVMFKDNHLVGAGIGEMVSRARAAWPARTVHVECDTFEQFVEAVAAAADAVLLDNMSVDVVALCVKEAENLEGHRPLLEVSGGVTLDNVADLAATGVDFISTSVITASAPVLDLGLDLAE